MTRDELRQPFAPIGAARGERLAKAVVMGDADESIERTITMLIEENEAATSRHVKVHAGMALKAFLITLDALLARLKAEGVIMEVSPRTATEFEEIAGMTQ